MKDVVLSENEGELSFALNEVSSHSEVVVKKFVLIFERYLGDKTDIQHAFQAFLDWKKNRDEVITLTEEGNREEAAHITKGKGAKHEACLMEGVSSKAVV